jgi:glycosyltransferase involved in cell wall biosynthesis
VLLDDGPGPMTALPFVVSVDARGDGGIARYTRLVLAALEGRAELLDLTRTRPLHPLPAWVRATSTRSRLVHAARIWRAWTRGPARRWLFTHYALTQPLALASPHDRSVVLAHGMEVWSPLPARRAIGLARTGRMVFTTRYSLDRFREANPRLAADLACLVSPLCAGPEWESAPLVPPPGDGRFRLLCLTRLTRGERAKGVSTLLAAVRELPDVSLVMVGDGDGREGYERESRELGLAARVRWTGWVPEPMKRALLEKADLVCLPSAQEGFGLSLLEAMTTGRPCVGSAAGALPEVLTPDVSELAPHGDPSALAEAIDRLRRRLAAGELTPESIRAATLARYGWSSFRERWAGLLA